MGWLAIAKQVQGFIACRPWLPWLCPLAVYVWHFSMIQLLLVVQSLNSSPTHAVLVMFSVAAAVATIPLYQRTYVSVVLLYGMVVLVLCMVQHILGVCIAFHNPVVCLTLGAIDFPLLVHIVAVTIGCSGRTLRPFVWKLFQSVLPVVLLPQICVLILLRYQFSQMNKTWL